MFQLSLRNQKQNQSSMKIGQKSVVSLFIRAINDKCIF